jgi:hypothetical protein
MAGENPVSMSSSDLCIPRNETAQLFRYPIWELCSTRGPMFEVSNSDTSRARCTAWRDSEYGENWISIGMPLHLTKAIYKLAQTCPVTKTLLQDAQSSFQLQLRLGKSRSLHNYNVLSPNFLLLN